MTTSKTAQGEMPPLPEDESFDEAAPPDLPEPAGFDVVNGFYVGLFTADQMQAYARAAIATAQAAAGVPVGAIHKDTLAMLPNLRTFDGGAKLWPTSKAEYDTDYVLVFAAPSAPAQSDSAGDARDAAFDKLAFVEDLLAEFGTPIGQECCGKAQYECCGNAEPVYMNADAICERLNEMRKQLVDAAFAASAAKGAE